MNQTLFITREVYKNLRCLWIVLKIDRNVYPSRAAPSQSAINRFLATRIGEGGPNKITAFCTFRFWITKLIQGMASFQKNAETIIRVKRPRTGPSILIVAPDKVEVLRLAIHFNADICPKITHFIDDWRCLDKSTNAGASFKNLVVNQIVQRTVAARSISQFWEWGCFSG